MSSNQLTQFALHGVGIDAHMILPGDPEPAWLGRNAEHRRLLGEMPREARAAALLSTSRDDRRGFVSRVFASFGRAS